MTITDSPNGPWQAGALLAFEALVDRDASGEEARGCLSAVATEDLLQIERRAVRLIWAARELREERKPK